MEEATKIVNEISSLDTELSVADKLVVLQGFYDDAKKQLYIHQTRAKINLSIGNQKMVDASLTEAEKTIGIMRELKQEIEELRR